MYTAVPDPYCYAGSDILKNIPGFRDARRLAQFEAAMTAQRAEEPFPSGRLSVTHYRAIHRHLFQDIYRWAGQFRRIRIAKDESMFCYPENISREMMRLFRGLREWDHLRGATRPEFADRASVFLADLNAIHCFRDGNGRSQLAFMAILANRAGLPLKLKRLDPARFLSAMIRSFHGDRDALIAQIHRLTR
jgi:cell filamentation protein